MAVGFQRSALAERDRQRLDHAARAGTPLRDPLFGSTERYVLRAPVAVRAAVGHLPPFLPWSRGREPDFDGPRDVDQRRRLEMFRHVAPQISDVVINLRSRGGVGIAPDADVVIAARMRAVLQQLVGAVALV